MTIKISMQSSGYTAEVTPPDGQWRSSHPMASSELTAALIAIGCDEKAIDEAFFEDFFEQYRLPAGTATPLVKAALGGQREVPPQPPITEAWLTVALFDQDKELTIQMLMEIADSIRKLLPTADEISWAFQCLEKRGWLTQRGELYGLTPEARRTIADIVGEGGAWGGVKRLKEWMLVNPPPEKQQ